MPYCPKAFSISQKQRLPPPTVRAILISITTTKGVLTEMDNFAQIIEIIDRQEELVRFEHFSNNDAWELGKFLVNKVQKNQMELSIAIRRVSGNIIFQYATERTNLSNQNWMRRKFNTVRVMNCSSLKAWAVSFLSGEQVPTHGLSDTEYVFCGGGFPIRMKTGEIVAILTVSNLPHEKDHQFIVDALSEWLSIENVPALPL